MIHVKIMFDALVFHVQLFISDRIWLVSRNFYCSTLSVTCSGEMVPTAVLFGVICHFNTLIKEGFTV